MSDALKTYTADPELATLLKAAARSDGRLRVKADEETYELEVKPGPTGGKLWADYDAGTARAAWQASSGSLTGVDADELIRELKAEREQHSGRAAT